MILILTGALGLLLPRLYSGPLYLDRLRRWDRPAEPADPGPAPVTDGGRQPLAATGLARRGTGAPFRAVPSFSLSQFSLRSGGRRPGLPESASPRKARLQPRRDLAGADGVPRRTRLCGAPDRERLRSRIRAGREGAAGGS